MDPGTCRDFGKRMCSASRFMEGASSNSSATSSITRENKEDGRDSMEKDEIARQARNPDLRWLVPTKENSLPRGYRRWEATQLRKRGTGTALTPAKLPAYGLLRRRIIKLQDTPRRHQAAFYENEKVWKKTGKRRGTNYPPATKRDTESLHSPDRAQNNT